MQRKGAFTIKRLSRLIANPPKGKKWHKVPTQTQYDHRRYLCTREDQIPEDLTRECRDLGESDSTEKVNKCADSFDLQIRSLNGENSLTCNYSRKPIFSLKVSHQIDFFFQFHSTKLFARHKCLLNFSPFHKINSKLNIFE